MFSFIPVSTLLERLYNEILAVVGDGPEPVTLQDLNKLTYLEQVLKETMRIFAIIPVMGRTCTEDLKLSDVTVPENSTILISILGLHMNETVYPDPLRFDPERFSAENSSQRHSYAFLPFSGGARNCIGRVYAMITMKVALVNILRRYEISSDVDLDDITYHFSITLKHVGGYNISIKKRAN